MEDNLYPIVPDYSPGTASGQSNMGIQSPRKTSENGLRLIKCFEACRLTAYKDTAGVLTIGFGHTEDVHDGQTCTQEQADEWLKSDVVVAEDAINRRVGELTQYQFDSLVSFAFNVGAHAFAKSTLCHRLRDGEPSEAVAQLAQWVHVSKDKINQIENGLVIRRGIESYIFQKGYTPAVMLWIMAKEEKC